MAKEKEIKLPPGYKLELSRISKEKSVKIEVGHAVIYRSERQNQAFISPLIVKELFSKGLIEYVNENLIRISPEGKRYISGDPIESVKKRRKRRD